MSPRNPLIATSHLRNETWPLRGDASTIPHVAWERGQPVDIDDPRVEPHDEARYDPVLQVVLFRKGWVLITCYSMRPEFVTNQAGEATLEAVTKRYGSPQSHSPPTTPRLSES